jgi:hypothetical protein
MFGKNKAGGLTVSQDAGFRVSLGDRDSNPKSLIQSQLLQIASSVTSAGEKLVGLPGLISPSSNDLVTVDRKLLFLC